MHKLAIKRNEPSLESDLLFHNALVEASNNFVMAKVYESISDLLTSIRKELLDFENKEKKPALSSTDSGSGSESTRGRGATLDASASIGCVGELSSNH